MQIVVTLERRKRERTKFHPNVITLETMKKACAEFQFLLTGDLSSKKWSELTINP